MFVHRSNCKHKLRIRSASLPALRFPESTATMLPDSEPDSALEARQRRMERRRTSIKRGIVKEEEDDDDGTITSSMDDVDAPDDSDEDAPPVKKFKLSLYQIRGIKKQARYEPEVPMKKEDLASWRKEARRVRNRESAAASRQKTRQRIEELEAQVDTIQLKYDAALRRILELESDKRDTPNTSISENMKDHSPGKVDTVPNHVSPPLSPRDNKEVLPDTHEWSLPHQQAAQALADSLSFNLDELNDPSFSPSYSTRMQQQKRQKQHPVTISRPTAV